MRSLEDYREIVGDRVISQIHRLASKLYGKHIVHVNSTYQGGGVAEILESLVPLMNDAGLDADWRILHGTPDFFTITKKFHNALQGESINFTEMKKRLYLQANEDFSVYANIDHDCVIVHDPQPLPLIRFYKKRQPWIWRCHVDCSNPNEEVWDYFKNFVLRYDAIIISSEDYRRVNLPVDQRIIHPAIDPLDTKNIELSDSDIEKYLKKFDVPTDKPLITQISRFDKWKDPEGVLNVFKLVKEKVDCRLVLCGSMASDDPEGMKIYEKVRRKAKNLIKNNDVILITSENNILVNALQRTSNVIVQKSQREGFGLTITEALWKGTPVVASSVGGICLQIIDGENGFLLEPNDNRGFADRITQLLKNPNQAKEMGKKGKEIVRKNFLITRLLMDYLILLNDVII
ncbi:MAG: glycosyltransferase [Candidatus Jordarchaeum sp.]|uniref:glycosyltransferase n=1 Tax=Candidatus Jordarchaeum sp. TaxID=2823881 RepID=UPI00404BA268